MQTNEEITKTIATRISAIRQTRGMSRDDLAESAGITPTKLGRVENGSSELSAVELVAVARSLGVTTAVLTSEERYSAFRERIEKAFDEANAVEAGAQ